MQTENRITKHGVIPQNSEGNPARRRDPGYLFFFVAVDFLRRFVWRFLSGRESVVSVFMELIFLNVFSYFFLMECR